MLAQLRLQGRLITTAVKQQVKKLFDSLGKKKKICSIRKEFRRNETEPVEKWYHDFSNSYDAASLSHVLVNLEETVSPEITSLQYKSNVNSTRASGTTFQPNLNQTGVFTRDSSSTVGYLRRLQPRKPVKCSPADCLALGASSALSHVQEPLRIPFPPSATSLDNASTLIMKPSEVEPFPTGKSVAHGKTSASNPVEVAYFIDYTEANERHGPQGVIFLDSFPGMRNIKTPWQILDTFTLPAPPTPRSAQPQSYLSASTHRIPVKKRRLLSRKTTERHEWFANPLRPQLSPILESSSSLEGDNERGLSPSGPTSPAPTSELSLIPAEVSLNPDLNHTTENQITSPRNPELEISQGHDVKIKNKDKTKVSPSPNEILASLFKMMEEDCV